MKKRFSRRDLPPPSKLLVLSSQAAGISHCPIQDTGLDGNYKPEFSCWLSPGDVLSNLFH